VAVLTRRGGVEPPPIVIGPREDVWTIDKLGKRSVRRLSELKPAPPTLEICGGNVAVFEETSAK
jgi:hypothetical protein